MRKFPLKHVFNYLPNAIRKLEGDDDQLLSWAAQAFKKFNYPSLLWVKDICFIPVNNHKFQIPDNVRKINSIKVWTGTPLTEEETTSIFNDDGTINYETWIESKHWNSFWIPMEYFGSGDKNYTSKINVSTCTHVYMDVEGSTNIKQASFEEGVVALEYYREEEDGEGDIMIPEYPVELWEALADWVKWKHIENRALYGERMQMNPKQFEMDALMRIREARSILRLKAFNYKLNKDIVLKTARRIGVPQGLRDDFTRYTYEGIKNGRI